MAVMSTLNFSQFSVIIPFLFRYFALCRGRVLSGWSYAALLAVCGVASGYQLPYMFIGGMNTAEPTEALLTELSLLDPATPNATTTRFAIGWLSLPVKDGGPGNIDSRA